MNSKWIVFILTLWVTTGMGQPVSGLDTLGYFNEQSGPDSSVFRIYTLGDIRDSITFSDTTLSGFDTYAPDKVFDQATYNLGNLGSSGYPVTYKLNPRVLEDIGFHQYDLNTLKLEDFRYFAVNRPFNDLYFTPLAGQQNFLVKATFARSFKNNVSLVIDYKRINQEGFYDNQKTKLTNLGVGLAISRPEKRHDFFFTFLANNFNEQHNGGATTDTIFQFEVYRLRSAVPTMITDGNTRHENWTYAFDNFFSTKNERYTLHHRLKYENGYIQYADATTSASNDSLLYLSFLNDQRGLRYYFGKNMLTNSLQLIFNQKAIGLSVGAKHRLSRFDNDIMTYPVNEVVLTGAIDLGISNVLNLSTQGEIEIVNAPGNINLNANLNFTPVKAFEIFGQLNISRFNPAISDREFYVNKSRVYNNTFDKINAFSIRGGINIPGTKTRFEVTTGVVDNIIYTNPDALPEQYNDAYTYFQLRGQQNFRWKFIGMENDFVIQSFNENLFQLPQIYSRHNLFVESFLFKRRLLSRLGVLLFISKSDLVPAFMPISGRFYQTDTPAEFYPYTEVYATFKISAFRFFIRADNFTDLLLRDVHFQARFYPQFDYKLRIGVRWLLKD